MTSLGIFIPGSVMIISFIVVFIKLRHNQLKVENAVEISQQRTMMKCLLRLSACYILLFLPICIATFFEYSALGSSIINCLYFPTYVINFFFYIYEWEVFQAGSRLLIRETKELVGIIVRGEKEGSQSSARISDTSVSN